MRDLLPPVGWKHILKINRTKLNEVLFEEAEAFRKRLIKALDARGGPDGEGYLDQEEVRRFANRYRADRPPNERKEENRRRGHPGSWLAMWLPVFTYLIHSGLSDHEAIHLILKKARQPHVDPENAIRQLNRMRSPGKKAAHQVAQAIVEGSSEKADSKRFRNAWRKLHKK